VQLLLAFVGGVNWGKQRGQYLGVWSLWTNYFINSCICICL